MAGRGLFKKAELEFDVVALLVAGITMLITGTLLFPVSAGLLPYTGVQTLSKRCDLREIRAFQATDDGALEIGACIGVKNIGKPCTGKPYARFDEGEQAFLIMHRLVRHRQTKEAATDRLTLRSKRPVLYSTPQGARS